MLNVKKNIKKYKGEYYSQLKQDVLALVLSNYSTSGFFVEFGGYDGITGSNTYLLEKSFYWNGIIAEPSKKMFEQCRLNRKSIVENLAVFSSSNNKILFRETNNDLQLSGITDYLPDDALSLYRNNNNIEYEVDTISLNDLLDKHNAPTVIDYISIDTEGTEYEILKSFNFKKRHIKLITIEHNFDAVRRNQIKDCLEKNGFVRILEDMSNYDDWYVRK